MALRLTWYRQRIATVADASFISWPDGRLNEDTAEGRFEGRCWQAGEGGEPLGAGVAVFRVWRTDVDHETDVPMFGPENDENTDYESHSFTRRSERTVFMVEGELWRDEWIEPATHSVRIRRDDVPPTAFFATDAAGTRESRVTLNSEDVGKYLWFRGGVIPTLLQHRGSKLEWYTADTGNVELTRGYRVHFGMNGLGLINVYAYDIARLPDWQQQIWAGYNVAPEGGVSEELLAAQTRRWMRSLQNSWRRRGSGSSASSPPGKPARPGFGTTRHGRSGCSCSPDRLAFCLRMNLRPES